MADYGVTDTEYCVVSGSKSGSAAFFEKVQSRMRDEWKCQGGVAVTPQDGLFQAMVKETEMRASEHARKYGASGGSGCNRKTRRRNRNRNRSRRN